MYCALAMANRRLALDSPPTGHQQIHLQFRKVTYLTTYLVLVSFLISAQCANFNQPRYDIVYSNELKSKPDELNRSVYSHGSVYQSYGATNRAKQTESLLDKVLQERREQRNFLRSLNSPIKRSSSYSRDLPDPNPFDIAYDWPPTKQERQKLDQQWVDPGRISSPLIASNDKENSDENQQQIEFEYDSQQSNNPTTDLFYLADQLAQDYNQPLANEGSVKDIYQLENEFNSDENVGNSETSSKESTITISSQDVKDNRQPQRNFTTLLEDADETISKQASSEVDGDPATTTATTTTTTTTTPSPSFVHDFSKWHRSTSGENTNNAKDNSWGATFNRLYSNIAYYLPSWSWFGYSAQKKNESEPDYVIVKKDNLSSGSVARLFGEFPRERQTTKQSVSVVESSGNDTSNDNDDQLETQEARAGEKNDMKAVKQDMKKNDKPSKKADNQQQDDNRFQVGVESSGVKVSIFKDDDQEPRVTVHDEASSDESDDDESDDHIVTHYVHRAKNLELPVERQQTKHKVSLMRESSISLPYKANDEFMIKETSKAPESLLGRYIYAPEHHYHLSTVMSHETPRKPGTTTTLLVGSTDEQPAMSQRSYMRHMRPEEDNGIFGGPFGGLRSIYGSGDGLDGGGLAGKTNDFYFLVMVGAFCVMAMAVVLSAGLFAYRIQQNRKTTAESDYPTYGVVGPNNMNGKCGAAAFMGGYFGSPTDRAASSSSSPIGGKTGSVKRMPDGSFSDGTVSAMSNRSSGKRHTNSTSELATQAGKANSFMVANQNAARMYHYQHQKQQMIISDHTSAGRHTSASDLDSEDEGDEGYTVYECPGLASAHEMEIKNPLFNDDQSP